MSYYKIYLVLAITIFALRYENLVKATEPSTMPNSLEQLPKAGVDVDATNHFGETPLLAPEDSKEPSTIEALIKIRDDINATHHLGIKGESQDLKPQSSPIYEIRFFVGGKEKSVFGGTAFFIGPNLLMTALHVIYPLLEKGDGSLDSIILSQPLKNMEFDSEELIDSSFRIKRIVALSIMDDLAILETEEESKDYLSFRENPLSIDEDLFVVGYPSGKFVKLKKRGPLHRYVMPIKRSFFVEEIEIDILKSLEGMSGSPVIDQYGKVVGIFISEGGTVEDLLVFTYMNQERFGSFNRINDSSFMNSDVSAKVLLNQAIQFTYDKANEGRVDAQYALADFLLQIKGSLLEGLKWLMRAARKKNSIFSIKKKLSNVFYSSKKSALNVDPYFDEEVKDFLILSVSFSQRFYSFFNKKSFDSEWGISLLEKAAHLGSGRAMVGLMEIYYKGRLSVEKNLDKAIGWALEAVEQNYISVLGQLEKDIREGHPEAFIVLKTIAEQTDKKWVQFKLSEMYFLKGDFSRGLELLEKLAEDLYPEAQFKLSQMYLEGSGVERNPFRAFELLKPLAKSRHSEAQFQLALMYRDGNGVEKNLTEARHWLERIILEKGSFLPLAYLEIGKLKLNGGLLSQLNAEDYLIKAIKYGVSEARLRLIRNFLNLSGHFEETKNNKIKELNDVREEDRNLFKDLEGEIKHLTEIIEESLSKAIIHLTVLASEGSSFGQSNLNQLTEKYNFMAQAALIHSSLYRIVAKDVAFVDRLKAPLEFIYWYMKSILQYGVQPVHNQVRQVRNNCYQVFKNPSFNITVP